MNDHIKSVADRFAAEGYNVVAPELLPEGVLGTLTPQVQRDLFTPEKRNEIQPMVRAITQPLYQPVFAAAALKTLSACVDLLLEEKTSSGKIGVVGFCFGGTYAFHLAAHDSRIAAVVPFYGQRPTAEELRGINCPVLAFYGDKDARLMETLPSLKEETLRERKEFEAVVYPGAGHAFFNDTNARAYNAEAAGDAWGKTLAFLKTHLA